MEDAAGWRRDPEDETRERYWDGSGWTDSVRPVVEREPDHVPPLHRALAAATDDIDAVEARLSELFERTKERRPGAEDSETTVAPGDDAPAAEGPPRKRRLWHRARRSPRGTKAGDGS